MKIMSGYDRILNLINIIKTFEKSAVKELKVTNIPNLNVPAYKKVSKGFDYFVKSKPKNVK